MANCIVCGGISKFSFSKDYAPYPGCPWPNGFSADYFKCIDCGFTYSRTHYEMGKDDWSRLNESWHIYHESGQSKTVNQPPYLQMALALSVLIKNNLLKNDSVLDYAAGFGTLGNTLSRYFGINIDLFDEFVQSEDAGYVAKDQLSKYHLVINSAMFEHVVDRSGLDAVNDLVRHDGVLMLHTLVAENIPSDPNWFYLEPHVHSSFFTNQSMEKLMLDWGYSTSIYCPSAKSWFLFKGESPFQNLITETVYKINTELQTEYLLCKDGFLDYWK